MTRASPDNTQDNSPDSLDNSLDIGTAAARLGVSTDTVRKRLQRKKIKGFKTSDGAWRVVLPVQDNPGQAGQKPGQPPGQMSTPSPEAIRDGSAALMAALRDEVAFLRSQLQARDDEIRRAHILLQQAQQRQALAAPAYPRPPWWRRWLMG